MALEGARYIAYCREVCSDHCPTANQNIICTRFHFRPPTKTQPNVHNQSNKHQKLHPKHPLSQQYSILSIYVFIISRSLSMISPMFSIPRPSPGTFSASSAAPAVSTSSAVLTGGKRPRRSISSLQSRSASAVRRAKRSGTGAGGSSGTVVKLGSNLWR